MGWTRLKWILAAVLLAANLILLYEIVIFHHSSAYLPQQSLEQVQLMLAENGIAVAESAVDNKKNNLVIYEGTLGEDYYTRIAEKLSGSVTELYFNTPNGVVMNMKNGDRFSFYDGFGIRYEAENAPDMEEPGALAERELLPLSAAEERALKRTVSSFLALAENGMGEAQLFRLSDEVVYTGEDPESGIRYCVCVQKARNTEILSLISAFAVQDGRVIGASGTRCFAQLDTSYSAQLMDQVNILYSVKNRVQEERKENGVDVVVIESLRMKYASYFRSDSNRFYLIPVWHTEMNSGKDYTVNAVDGSLYTN